MRKTQAKKLRKAAAALAKLSGTSTAEQYKAFKKVHKSLSHNEKK